MQWGQVVGVVARRAALGAVAVLFALVVSGPAAAEAADRETRSGQSAGSGQSGDQQCVQQTVEVGIIEADGCFTVSGDVYTSAGEVDVNGFTVDPTAQNADRGAAIQIDKAQQHFTTAGKKVGFSASPLDFGAVPLDFNIPASGELHLGDYAFSGRGAGGNVAYLLEIATPGLAVPVTLTEGGGEVVLSIQAKGLLALIERDQSIGVTAEVKPHQGASFDGAEIELSGVKIGPLELEKLEATFRTNGTWGGSVDVKFPRGGGETFEVEGQIHFADGQFKDVGINIDGLDLQLGSGLVLDQLGGTLTLNPFSLAANTRVYWGQEVTVFGHKVALFELDGALTVGGPNPAFLDLKAAMKIIGAQVANGELMLFIGEQATGASLDVSAGIGLPSFTNDPGQPTYLGIGLSGWAGEVKGQPKYDIEGSGTIKALGINLLRGDVVVSDIGIAVCWRIIGIPGGIGARWGQPVSTFGIGCGLQAFQEPKPSIFDGGAQGRRRAFQLDGRPQVLRVRGRGGAPRFVLRRADGRVIRTVPGTESRGHKGRDYAVMHNEEADETYVFLRNARGTWMLTQEPGSPRVTAVQTAHPAPMPRNIRARVTGRGRYRTLHWSAQRLGNHRLVFEEVLPGGHRRPILTTSKARGSYRFLPQQTHFGERRLRVRIQHGLGSRGHRILGRYRVARPPAPIGPKPPARVRARRVGNKVTAEFSRVPRARGYEVSVLTGNGRARYVKRVGRNARRAVIPGTGRRGRMVAEVRSIGANGRVGRRKRSARVAVTRPPVVIPPGLPRAGQVPPPVSRSR